MSNSPILDSIPSKTYIFVLFLVYITLFGRIFSSLGAPNIVKLLHFPFAAVIFFLILPFIQSALSKKFFIGLAILFLVVTASALLNGAGIANVVLDFLLLSEPFILLILFINRPMPRICIGYIQLGILFILMVHVTFSYYQFVTEGYSESDLVKGIFLEQGAGHHVGGAVALSGAVYFLLTSYIRSFVARVTTAILASGVVIASDSKQVIAVFLASLGVVLLTKVKDIRQFLRYMLVTIVCLGLVLGSAVTVFPALTVWADIELIRKGLEVKLGIVPLIISHYETFMHVMFGLGPGHTVGRLALMLPDYLEHLKLLGATLTRVTEEAKDFQQANYVSNSVTGSSMWSPLFFWAGLWGDLGVAGGMTYIYLWFLVLREVCRDDLSRYFVFTIIILGGVFAWLEEPGYMLFVVTLIGLGWQDHQTHNSDIVPSS